MLLHWVLIYVEQYKEMSRAENCTNRYEYKSTLVIYTEAFLNELDKVDWGKI